MTYEEKDAADEGAQPRTAFREAEKRYQLFRERKMKMKGGKRRAGKWQTRPIDMIDVLDLHEKPCDPDQVARHDVPGYYGPVFTFARHRGLVYLPGALNVAQQSDLIQAALMEYPEPPARTNHTLQYGPLPGLWRAAQAGLRLNWTRKDDPHTGSSRSTGCQHTSAKPHKIWEPQPAPACHNQDGHKRDQQQQEQIQHPADGGDGGRGGAPVAGLSQCDRACGCAAAGKTEELAGPQPVSCAGGVAAGGVAAGDGQASGSGGRVTSVEDSTGNVGWRRSHYKGFGDATDQRAARERDPGQCETQNTGTENGHGRITGTDSSVQGAEATACQGGSGGAGGAPWRNGPHCHSAACPIGDGDAGGVCSQAATGQGVGNDGITDGGPPCRTTACRLSGSDSADSNGGASSVTSSGRSSGCGSADLPAGGDDSDGKGDGGSWGILPPSFEAAWGPDGPGPPGEQLLRKLRWATLGPQFNWTQRQYEFGGAYRSLPPSLEALAKQLAAVVDALQGAGLPMLPQDASGAREGYRPDAAIVNYYQLGDMLGGHLDDVERDLDQPIVSVSLGCPAIFLMGGPTKHLPPTAMLLRGGDVLVLAGEARRCYHGVPRILETPQMAQPAAKASAGPAPTRVETYPHCARINISIRAVR